MEEFRFIDSTSFEYRQQRLAARMRAKEIYRQRMRGRLQADWQDARNSTSQNQQTPLENIRIGMSVSKFRRQRILRERGPEFAAASVDLNKPWKGKKRSTPEESWARQVAAQRTKRRIRGELDRLAEEILSDMNVFGSVKLRAVVLRSEKPPYHGSVQQEIILLAS